MNRFGIAFISLMIALAAGSANATTKIKIATIVPPGSSWAGKIDAARTEIKERTEGRVELKVYYGGIQGNSAKIKQKIKIGQLHGGDFSPTDFQDKMPELNLYGLPFVFQSIDEVNYVRRHMDDLLADGFAEQDFVTFGFAGDFAIILSNTPIRGLKDLRGRKIWLPQGDAISDRAMRELRLVPNSKPVSDVLTGLRTGLFDVVPMPPAAAIALQWHTAVKYYTDMPVLYAMQFLAIKKSVVDKLSADDQAVMREVLTRVYTEINDQNPIDATNAKEALSNSGIESILPNEGEFNRLQAAMAKINRDMAEQGMFSVELLDLMQRHIDDYRSEHLDAEKPIASEADHVTTVSSGGG